ncbi:neuromedin-U isoform X2 [Stigmatopora nigra]
MPTKEKHPSYGTLTTAVGRGSVNPLGVAGIGLAAILLLDSILFLHSAPLEPWQDANNHGQLLSQIATACSSFLSADIQAPDVLGEICFLMLVQKSKEFKGRENNKKLSPGTHPLLQLVPQLHTRLERELRVQAELEGPGGIQSRGYFLYRPRNGRRGLDNE